MSYFKKNKQTQTTKKQTTFFHSVIMIYDTLADVGMIEHLETKSINSEKQNTCFWLNQHRQLSLDKLLTQANLFNP